MVTSMATYLRTYTSPNAGGILTPDDVKIESSSCNQHSQSNFKSASSDMSGQK